MNRASRILLAAVALPVCASLPPSRAPSGTVLLASLSAPAAPAVEAPALAPAALNAEPKASPASLPADAHEAALALARQGLLDSARAVSLKAYDPVLNDHLGDVYAKVGRTLEARYQWQRALDYADKDKDADLIKAVTKKLETGQVAEK